MSTIKALLCEVLIVKLIVIFYYLLITHIRKINILSLESFVLPLLKFFKADWILLLSKLASEDEQGANVFSIVLSSYAIIINFKNLRTLSHSSRAHIPKVFLNAAL